jgi:hypothetical protein
MGRSDSQSECQARLIIDLFVIHDKPNPFALSLSKGVVIREGFDRACPEPVEGLSPNGVMNFEKLNNLFHAAYD